MEEDGEKFSVHVGATHWDAASDEPASSVPVLQPTVNMPKKTSHAKTFRHANLEIICPSAKTKKISGYHHRYFKLSAGSIASQTSNLNPASWWESC